MSSLKMNAGLQGQMGTKRLLHIWQTGKCMTNMSSCDNQKQMYYSHLTCNHSTDKCMTNMQSCDNQKQMYYKH